MKKLLALGAAVTLFVPSVVRAHCPLCTIGAGLAASGAAWLGMKAMGIGVFLGAFAIAIGLWLGKLIKKKYFRQQSFALGILSFVLTIIPLQPLFQDYASIYISLSGDYGSWLNRTYAVDTFLVGSVIGGLILLISPVISKAATKWRSGKMLPFQGLVITFFLLILAAVIAQFIA